MQPSCITLIAYIIAIAMSNDHSIIRKMSFIPRVSGSQASSCRGTGLYLSKLRHKGKKLTIARRLILEVFCRFGGPYTAIELIALLGRHRPDLKIHKTTVYRELAFLREEKLITEFVFADGQGRYELVQDGHFHHLICLNCHKIDRVELENDLDKAERVVKRRTKFQVLHHSLEFYGLCSSCR